MRNSKKIMLTAFVCSAVSSLVVGGVALGNAQPAVEAKAETIATFLVKDAGSIRTKDPVGIRFATTIDEATATQVAELTDVTYGTLLIPTDLLTGELTKETAKVLDVEAKMLQGDVYTGVLVGEDNGDGTYTNLPESYYNRPISARGYVTGKNGETTVTYYTNNTVSKSIGYVAKMAEMDPEATMTELLTTIVSKTTIALDMSDINLSLLKVANNALAVSDNTQAVANATFTVGGVAITDAAVTYEIADINVAKLAEDNKTVVAVADGTTTIKATYVFDETTYTVTKNITVKDTVDTTPITIDTMIDATWAIAVPETYGALTAIKNGDTVVSDTNGVLTEAYVTAKTAGTEETLTFVTEKGEYNVPVNYVKTAYTALDHSKFQNNLDIADGHASNSTYERAPQAFANRPNAYLMTNAKANSSPWYDRVGVKSENGWSQADYLAIDLYLQLPAGTTTDRIIIHNGAAMAHIAFKTNTGYFVVSEQGYQYTTVPTEQWVTLFVPIATYSMSSGNAFYIMFGLGGASNTGVNGSVYIDNVRFYNTRQYTALGETKGYGVALSSFIFPDPTNAGFTSTFTKTNEVANRPNAWKMTTGEQIAGNLWCNRLGLASGADTYYAKGNYVALDLYINPLEAGQVCGNILLSIGTNAFLYCNDNEAGNGYRYLDENGADTTFGRGKWVTIIVDMAIVTPGSCFYIILANGGSAAAINASAYIDNVRVYTTAQYENFLASFNG